MAAYKLEKTQASINTYLAHKVRNTWGMRVFSALWLSAGLVTAISNVVTNQMPPNNLQDHPDTTMIMKTRGTEQNPSLIIVDAAQGSQMYDCDEATCTLVPKEDALNSASNESIKFQEMQTKFRDAEAHAKRTFKDYCTFENDKHNPCETYADNIYTVNRLSTTGSTINALSQAFNTEDNQTMRHATWNHGAHLGSIGNYLNRSITTLKDFKDTPYINTATVKPAGNGHTLSSFSHNEYNPSTASSMVPITLIAGLSVGFTMLSGRGVKKYAESEAPRGKPRGITASRVTFGHNSSFACPLSSFP